MTTDPLQWMYDAAGNLPSSWWETAERLLLAAEFLEPHCALLNGKLPCFFAPQVDGVREMLKAMALECLLKGLWVKAGNYLATDGKFKKIPGTNNHNLKSIFEKVGPVSNLPFSSDECDLLERLSYSISGGRYPVPKQFADTSPRKLPNGDYGPPNIRRLPKDEHLFKEIVSKINASYGEIVPSIHATRAKLAAASKAPTSEVP